MPEIIRGRERSQVSKYSQLFSILRGEKKSALPPTVELAPFWLSMEMSDWLRYVLAMVSGLLKKTRSEACPVQDPPHCLHVETGGSRRGEG